MALGTKTMKKRHYDLIFSLGVTCVCSQALRRAGLQLASFPWDWIARLTVLERLRIACDDFRDWPRLEDLEWMRSPDIAGNKPHVECRRTGLCFLHDFRQGESVESQYGQFIEKYRRRFRRFTSCMESSRRVLMVSIVNPFNPVTPSIDECRECRRILSERFNGVKCDFLLLTVDEGRSFSDRVEEEVDEGLLHVAYDYRKLPANRLGDPIVLDQVAQYLASRFSVRDYRTVEEKKSYAKLVKRRRTERLRNRMAKFGATSRWQYELYRLRKSLRSVACVIGPRELLARRRQKRFDQIAILGANCETAFRFLSRWGFLDSSLFAWSFVPGLDALSFALENLDSIPNGGLSFNNRAKMWKSACAGIHFHGRMKFDMPMPPPTEQELDEDLADLRGRLGHLVEKLKTYLQNDKSTLLALRLPESDSSCDDLPEKFARLENALDRVGARNCTLLVICRRDSLRKLPPETEHRVYRCVKAFNPHSCAVLAETGDPVAWHAIFTEFAPTKIQKKAHAFKFEE